MNKALVGLLFTLLIFSCKQDPSKTITESEIDFSVLLNDFNEEGFQLDPMKATKAGDIRFNDAYPNFLSEDYKKKKEAYYKSYKEALTQIDASQLSETEKMNKAVLEWDCNINLDALTFKKI